MAWQALCSISHLTGLQNRLLSLLSSTAALPLSHECGKNIPRARIPIASVSIAYRPSMTWMLLDRWPCCPKMSCNELHWLGTLLAGHFEFGLSGSLRFVSPSVHLSFSPGSCSGYFVIFNSIGFSISGDWFIMGSIPTDSWVGFASFWGVHWVIYSATSSGLDFLEHSIWVCSPGFLTSPTPQSLSTELELPLCWQLDQLDRLFLCQVWSLNLQLPTLLHCQLHWDSLLLGLVPILRAMMSNSIWSLLSTRFLILG